MPADKSKTKSSNKTMENMEDEVDIAREEAPANAKVKKRPSSMANEEDSDSDCNQEGPGAQGENEMTALINSFGADISKTLTAKRKRLATFTSASLKTSNKKYDDIFVAQQSERDKMTEEFSKQIGSVFTQWECDTQKSKDSEEKLENLIKQLQKILQQQRVVQTQRLKSIKTLHDHYMKGLSDLSKVHRDQQMSINGELKREMSSLQKKMMEDARQEEIANVRKSLQSMLSQV